MGLSKVCDMILGKEVFFSGSFKVYFDLETNSTSPPHGL